MSVFCLTMDLHWSPLREELHLWSVMRRCRHILINESEKANRASWFSSSYFLVSFLYCPQAGNYWHGRISLSLACSRRVA